MEPQQTFSAPHSGDAAPRGNTLSARFLLPDGSEHSCRVTGIDPHGALFLTPLKVAPGLALIAYIEEVGRIEGKSGEQAEDGFWVSFTMSGAREARLRRHLRWLIWKEKGLALPRRRHTRYEPQNKDTRLSLPGGEEHPCVVIDISLSGAALRTSVRPPPGTCLMLGRMRGRVVRHLEEGIAIEFLKTLESGELFGMLR